MRKPKVGCHPGAQPNLEGVNASCQPHVTGRKVAVSAHPDKATASCLWLNLRPSVETPSRLVFVAGHAGAGLANLRGFERTLPSGWAVWALALPGRDRAMAEPADWNFGEIVETAAAQAVGIAEKCPAVPLAVVGQCLGAWLGYALLERAGAALQSRCAELTVISQAPWHIPRTDAPLPDDSDAMWSRLAASGDVPAEIAGDEEFRELLEPIMRADHTAMLGVPIRARPLSCPILVVGGRDDPALDTLFPEEWDRYAPSAHVVLVGSGHFPLQDDPAAVTRLLTGDQG